jgi:hypothetical protein
MQVLRVILIEVYPFEREREAFEMTYPSQNPPQNPQKSHDHFTANAGLI